MHDLTNAQFVKMKSKSIVDGYLGHATILQRKQLAKDLITNWCDAITRHEGDAFATEWVLGDAALETPKKRRRNDEEETAAVADPAN